MIPRCTETRRYTSARSVCVTRLNGPLLCRVGRIDRDEPTLLVHQKVKRLPAFWGTDDPFLDVGDGVSCGRCSDACHRRLGRRIVLRCNVGEVAGFVCPAVLETWEVAAVISMRSSTPMSRKSHSAPQVPRLQCCVVVVTPAENLFAGQVNAAVREQRNQISGGEYVASGHDLAQNSRCRDDMSSRGGRSAAPAS